MKAAQEATLSKILGNDTGRKRGRGGAAGAADGGEERVLAQKKKEARTRWSGDPRRLLAVAPATRLPVTRAFVRGSMRVLTALLSI